jgi:hypothetical protein
VDDRYRAEVMADSPAFYWRLQNIAPESATDEGATRNMSPTNFGWRQRGPWRGQRERSVFFDVALGVRATMTRWSNTGSMTYEAWVRTTSTDATSSYAGNPALTVVGDTSASVWMNFGVHGGKVRFLRFNNTAWQNVDSAKSVNDGAWHHIGATYDSSTRAVVVYVDGVADGSGTITAHQSQGGVDALGTGYNGNADTFDGYMAEVAVWASVLAPHRFRAHYLAGRLLFVPERRTLLRAA